MVSAERTCLGMKAGCRLIAFQSHPREPEPKIGRRLDQRHGPSSEPSDIYFKL
jgi:hypothetical protein